MTLKFEKLLSLVTLLLLIASGAQAQTLYVYNRLILKDLDQMNKLVQDKIREANESGDKVPALREALQAVYSRPNSDFMIEKVIGPLRTQLEEIDAYETTLRSLIDEAVQALKDPDKVKPAAQVTYQVLLENIMAELKPDVSKPFENSIITQIRDARIRITRKAESERALNTMKKVKSPSQIAKMILSAYEKEKKRKVKEKEE